MGQPFFRFLDTNGDGTGTKNATGNYASAADDFYLQHPANAVTKCYLHRMIIHIADSANPSADVYGNLAAALTNGIQFLVLDANGDTFRDLTDGEPVKSNAEYGKFCFDVELDSFGSGADFIQIRWTFEKAGLPIQLSPGWSFVARVNDDLTGLIDHYFNLQGVWS